MIELSKETTRRLIETGSQVRPIEQRGEFSYKAGESTVKIQFACPANAVERLLNMFLDGLPR